jgi:ATP-dependent helicase HrpB
MPPLPVSALLPELHEALARQGSAVLVAPPGAGKTTLVPLDLLRAPWLGQGKILLLEPRRLAARAAASRMADLLGEPDVGGTVGYRIRLDTRVGPNTRIEVVTEGVLTRMLQSDPSLEGVAAILFDEFHERSIHADLGLALALEARDLFRPDLRLLVMSATLDAEPVAALLAPPAGSGLPGTPAAVLRSEGRTHPVETIWRSTPASQAHPRGWIEPVVADTVRRALRDDEGDILVFLPGAAEIRRTAEALEGPGPGGGASSPEVSVHVLHGSLSRDAQDRALAPAPPGSRKVVLASAVAETSLTIEGVRVVVDAGLMRVPRFDAGSGLTRLETVRVTRDAADQRRGRAGRTAPGRCYRLWTQAEERGLVPTRLPELLEADLAPLVLELARWGSDPAELRWIDPPPSAAVDAARELLRLLGALDAEGALTADGARMAQLGAHPRVAHLLLAGRRMGLSELGCDLAALLEDRDILRAQGRAPDADLRLRVESLRRRGGGGAPLPGHEVDRGQVARTRKVAAEWRRRLGEVGGEAPLPGEIGTASDDPGDVAWTGVLAALAWPDRIGRARGTGGGGGAGTGAGARYLLSGGRGAVLDGAQTLTGTEWLVAVEVDGRGRDARIMRAAPLEPDDIEGWLAHLVEDHEEIRWNAEGGRVEALLVRRLGAVEVARAPLPVPDPERVARVLAEGVRSAGLEVLPWSHATRQLRDRLAFLHGVEPEAWPDVSHETLLETLEAWLLPMAPGARSLADLARVDLAEALLLPVDPGARGRLDSWAPTHLEVPSGSRIALDYSDPAAPVLAVRLQELFGMTRTPRLAGDRVPLTVHLLSPAQRPVQVTRDLESFWREGYFEVRKDLRGRYPKHYWPDDPLTAPATRRVRPRP